MKETADEVQRMCRRALVLPADVRDPEEVHAATVQAVASLGPIAVAVTGAGVNAWADLQHLAPSSSEMRSPPTWRGWPTW